jgi:hypothetical protein
MSLADALTRPSANGKYHALVDLAERILAEGKVKNRAAAFLESCRRRPDLVAVAIDPSGEPVTAWLQARAEARGEKCPCHC